MCVCQLASTLHTQLCEENDNDDDNNDDNDDNDDDESLTLGVFVHAVVSVCLGLHQRSLHSVRYGEEISVRSEKEDQCFEEMLRSHLLLCGI